MIFSVVIGLWACGNEAQDQVEVNNENIARKCSMSNLSSIVKMHIHWHNLCETGFGGFGPFETINVRGEFWV